MSAPIFQQLVDDKARFIGGTFIELDPHAETRYTAINEIALLPNGDSSVIHVTGSAFPVACDLRSCSIEPTFSGAYHITATFGTRRTLTPRKESV